MDQPVISKYLQKLSDLMMTTAATDRSGALLSLDEAADQAVEKILSVGKNSRKIMLVGNGGSSSVVSHVQNDLCKAVGVRAIVFTEQPLLTALGNDLGYGSVYQWPTDLWAEAGDLMIAVSSSGNSENILRAAYSSLEKGCDLITFSGFETDNSLRSLGALNFHVGSHVYGFVETAHAALTHFLTDRAMDILRASPKTAKAENSD
jgi:D-sedoheptulose 7-phosphate isomerase